MSSWWLPEDWSAAERTLHAAFQGFATDLLANHDVFSKAENEQFNTLYKDFLAWHDNLGFFSWMNSNNLQVVTLYAQNLKYWQDLYNSRSPTPAAGPGTSILLPKATPTTTDNLKYIAVASATAIGLTAIARIFRG